MSVKQVATGISKHDCGHNATGQHQLKEVIIKLESTAAFVTAFDVTVLTFIYYVCG